VRVVRFIWNWLVIATPTTIFSPQTMGFGGIAGPRRDLSRLTKVKAFPENIVVDVDLAFMRRDESGTNLGISYAIRRLPALELHPGVRRIRSWPRRGNPGIGHHQVP
jgi:hypothetical protein